MFKTGQNMMNRVFDVNNPIMRMFSKLFDLVVLNALFLIGCLPVVTIGVSLTAMYATTMKLVRDEPVSVVTNFIQAYKGNLKQGLFYWIIGLLIVTFLYVDNLFLFMIFPNQEAMIKMVFIACLVFAYFIYLYIFPLIAHYVYQTKEIYQTALKVSLSNVPWSLLLFAMYLPLIGMLLFSGVTMILLCLFMITIGFASIAFLRSAIFRKIFDKYE